MAHNKIENETQLTDFIMSICQHSLKQQGLMQRQYAFHLELAFKRQIVLKKTDISRLVESITSKPLTSVIANGAEEQKGNDEPSVLQIPQPIKNQIQAIAMSVVLDVKKADQDGYMMQLIKTSFLSTVNKSIKASEQALKVMCPEGQEKDDFGLALDAHIKYLNILSTLPFELEHAFNELRTDTGVHYDEALNAEVLMGMLSTAGNAGPSSVEMTLKQLMPLAKIIEPSLGMSDGLLKKMQTHYLPLANKLLQANKALNDAKAKLFPSDDEDKSSANRDLLKLHKVSLDGLFEICQNTLLNPIQQCMAGIPQLSKVVDLSMTVVNGKQPVDRMAAAYAIGKQVHLVSQNIASLPESMQPEWLKNAVGSYQQLEEGAQAVLKSLTTHGSALFGSMAYFVPSSLTSLFHGEAEKFWISLSQQQNQAAHDFDPTTLMAYLSFHELKLTSGIDDAKATKHFAAFVEDLSSRGQVIDEAYEKYSAFIDTLKEAQKNTKSASLLDQATALIGDQSPTFTDMLCMVNRMNRLKGLLLEHMTDIHGKQAKIELILIELLIMYKDNSNNQVISDFKTTFLKPALEEITRSYVKSAFLKKLEESVDLKETDASKKEDLFTKLSENALLSYDELSYLTTTYKEILPEIFTQVTDELNVAPSDPVKDAVASKTLTTQSALSSALASKLSLLKAPLKMVLVRLDEQEKTSKEWLSISMTPSDLHAIFTAKAKYIKSMHAIVEWLMNATANEADCHKLASSLIAMMDGSHLKASLSKFKQDPLPLLQKQLMPFLWQLIPADGPTTKSSMDNLLEYVLKENAPLIHDFMKSKKSFDTAVKKVKKETPLALTQPLSDPLSLNNLLKTEDLVNSMVDQLVTVGKKAFWEYGAEYAGKLAQYVTGANVKKLLENVCPYPFLVTIAMTVLESETVQKEVKALLKPMTDKAGKAIDGMITDLSGKAKEKLCYLLGIELEKEIANNAYKYISSHDEVAIKNDERDAFAALYLQYRAIKEANNGLATENCIKLLFKSVATKDEVIGQIKTKFEEMDTQLYPQQQTSENLQFLIDNIDFNNPNEKTLVQLALFNRMYLMTMGRAKEKKDNKLEIEAVTKLQNLLANIPADAVVEEAAQPVAAPKPESHREKFLALLDPSLKASKEGYQKKWMSQLKEVQQLVDKELKLAEELKLDGADYLGNTVLKMGYLSAKRNTPRAAVKIVSKVAEVVSLIATVMGEATAGLQYIQLLGGGALSLVASVTPFAWGIVAARLAWKLLTVFKGYSDEFVKHWDDIKDVFQDPDASLGKKTLAVVLLPFKYLLLTVKCVFISVFKTLLGDYLVDKITEKTSMLADKLSGAVSFFSWVRHGFRKYPTHDKVTSEIDKLAALKSTLEQETLTEDDLVRQVEQVSTQITLHDSDARTMQGQARRSTVLTRLLNDFVATGKTLKSLTNTQNLPGLNAPKSKSEDMILQYQQDMASQEEQQKTEKIKNIFANVTASKTRLDELVQLIITGHKEVCYTKQSYIDKKASYRAFEGRLKEAHQLIETIKTNSTEAAKLSGAGFFTSGLAADEMTNIAKALKTATKTEAKFDMLDHEASHAIVAMEIIHGCRLIAKNIDNIRLEMNPDGNSTENSVLARAGNSLKKWIRRMPFVGEQSPDVSGDANLKTLQHAILAKEAMETQLTSTFSSDLSDYFFKKDVFKENAQEELSAITTKISELESLLNPSLSKAESAVAVGAGAVVLNGMAAAVAAPVAAVAAPVIATACFARGAWRAANNVRTFFSPSPLENSDLSSSNAAAANPIDSDDEIEIDLSPKSRL
jgi:hypothetical protein